MQSFELALIKMKIRNPNIKIQSSIKITLLLLAFVFGAISSNAQSKPDGYKE